MSTLAGLLAGCSTDSTRFGDPFTNPFGSASNEPTGHVASARPAAIPAGRTPPVTSQALPPRGAPVASAAPLRPQVMTAYNRAPVSADTTGSIEPSPSRTAPGAAYGNWTSSGGVGITVGDADTVDALSKRYGVPPAALLQTNGYRSAADVRPGSRLTIPVYNAVAARATASAEAPRHEAQPEPRRIAEAAPARTVATRTVAERPQAERSLPRTVASAAPAPARPVKAVAEHGRGKDVARATVPAAEAKPVRQQAATKVPANKLQAAKASVEAPKLVAVTKPTVAGKPLSAKTAALAPVPAKPAPVQAAQPKAAEVASAAPAATPAAAPVSDGAGNPEFRWPARGRIIQGFKGGNDGINIAVPEGTAVKAAEGGTVAYAGSELKGYGNLVLIRHPNGYVTAYANNGELDVKRGDQVKRGQTIAKSGQSGNVSSPQLHFELRKGATPVDPTQYLAGL